MKRAAAVQYPLDGSGSGFTTLLGAANRERQMRLLEEARAHGAEVIALRPNDDGTLSEAGELGPHVVLAPPESSALATEEIFGPILPIVPYDTFEDVLDYINARPRPLAAYLFEDHRARRKQFLEGTTSGSVGVNDVIFQFVVDSAPFGGIGSSGMGAYHGEDGFREFSHRRTIFQQSKLTLRHFMTPPYGRVFRTVLRWFIR
jgi:acyl-CoA reductase-like NAD-dependent aldehyde dehydrogenase